MIHLQAWELRNNYPPRIVIPCGVHLDDSQTTNDLKITTCFWCKETFNNSPDKWKQISKLFPLEIFQD